MEYTSNLACPSLYDYGSHSDTITIERRALERCIRIALEEAMCDGGVIVELSRDCMFALDGHAL